MNNKGIKLTALVLIISVALIGVILFADFGDKDFAISVNLYFYNENSNGVVEEAREITYDKTEEIIPQIIKEIVKGPRQTDKKRIVKKGVKLNDIIYGDNGYAVIDLNDKFLSNDNTLDVLAAYTVIKAVCNAYPVTGITHVKLTVEGDDIATSDGKTLDYLTYEDIKLSDTAQRTKKEVLLYFKNSEKDGFGAEIRKLEISTEESLEKAVVEALLKGPKSDKLKQCVFGELISVDTKDGVCFVNLAFSFVEKNSGEGAFAAVYSIVNSLTELPGIDGVQILVDGKKLDKIGDVDISTVLGRQE